MLTTKRTVEVEAIGRLWMPGVEAAFTRKWKVGTGPWEKDLRTLGDIESLLMSGSSEGSGDFSEVIDWQAYWVVERRYTREGIVGVIVHTKVKLARGWEEEASEGVFEDLTCREEA